MSAVFYQYLIFASEKLNKFDIVPLIMPGLTSILHVLISQGPATPPEESDDQMEEGDETDDVEEVRAADIANKEQCHKFKQVLKLVDG